MRALRRAARRAVLHRFPAALRPFAALAMVVLWPVQSAGEAWHEAGRMAPGAFPGRSRRSLALAAWRAALRHNASPLEALVYRAVEDTSPGSWLYQYETKRLLAAMAAPAALTLAADKLAFAGFCDAAGLARVETLGVVRPGVAEIPEPPVSRILLKPVRGSNADGIRLFQRVGELWRGREGAPLDWSALARRLGAEAGQDGLLLQPLLAPHPELEHLGALGSPTARIVTGLHPDGRVEIVSAVFAAPRPGDLVSNGGTRRRIELTTGRLLPLGPGRLRDVFGDDHSDPRVDGLTLPDWPAAAAMAEAGHRAFPARAVMLGWDVAFCPSGPVLIETNAGLGFFMEQSETLEPASTAAGVIAAWLA